MRRFLLLMALIGCGVQGARAAGGFYMTITAGGVEKELQNESASGDGWRFDYADSNKSRLTIVGGATEAERKTVNVVRTDPSQTYGILAALVVTGKVDVTLQNIYISSSRLTWGETPVAIAPGSDVRLKFVGSTNIVEHVSMTGKSAITCPESSRLVLCGDETGFDFGYTLSEGDTPGKFVLSMLKSDDNEIPYHAYIYGPRDVVTIGNADGICGDIRLENINLAIVNNGGTFSQGVCCFGNGSGYENRSASVTFGARVAFRTMSSRSGNKNMLMRAMSSSHVHDEYGRPLAPFSENPNANRGLVFFLPVCRLTVKRESQDDASFDVWRHWSETTAE